MKTFQLEVLPKLKKEKNEYNNDEYIIIQPGICNNPTNTIMKYNFFVCVLFFLMGEETMNAEVPQAHDSHNAAWSSYEGKKIHFQRRNKIRPSSFVYTEWIGSSVL